MPVDEAQATNPFDLAREVAQLDPEARGSFDQSLRFRSRTWEQSKLLAQRVPIGDLVRDGVPEPAFLPSPTLGERLFYDGCVFLFAGHKKAGKSWAMTLEARDCIDHGRPVVYVDNENGPELFAERLALVGASPETVDARFHYVPFPRELAKPAELRPEIEAITRELPGAFIVLDSMRTFMARFGLSPNVDVEVEQFLGPIMGAVKGTPVAERPTVAVIDHSNRATRGGDEYVWRLAASPSPPG
jgi:hypothetical protein